MKVFISHQNRDKDAAERVARRLKIIHSIESYLDVIDPYIDGPIELLGDHIRNEMGKCTQLIAVISPATALSQWVPWEVGVATEKDLPLATYSDGTPPPEFLKKWPYLRGDRDLDEYANVSKSADRSFRANTQTLSATVARANSTRTFYKDLRAALNQGRG